MAAPSFLQRDAGARVGACQAVSVPRSLEPGPPPLVGTWCSAEGRFFSISPAAQGAFRYTEPCESGPIQGILEPERASRAWVAEVWHLGMGCHVGCVRIRLECSKAPQAVASWFVVSQVSVNGEEWAACAESAYYLSRDGCGPSPPWSPEREAPAPSAAAGTQPSVAAGEAWQPRGTLGRQGPLVPSRYGPPPSSCQATATPPSAPEGVVLSASVDALSHWLQQSEGPDREEKRRLLFKCAGVRDLLFAGGPGAAGAGPRLDGCRVEIARGAVEAAVRALEPLQPERREHPGAGEAAALPAEADLVEEVVALLQAATAKKDRRFAPAMQKDKIAPAMAPLLELATHSGGEWRDTDWYGSNWKRGSNETSSGGREWSRSEWPAWREGWREERWDGGQEARNGWREKGAWGAGEEAPGEPEGWSGAAQGGWSEKPAPQDGWWRRY